MSMAHPTSTLETRKRLPVLLLGTVQASSEADGHAIEQAFDHDHGPGATRWKAGKPGEQTITVAFELPCALEQVTIQVEEQDVPRTQRSSSPSRRMAPSLTGNGFARNLPLARTARPGRTRPGPFNRTTSRT